MYLRSVKTKFYQSFYIQSQYQQDCKTKTKKLHFEINGTIFPCSFVTLWFQCHNYIEDVASSEPNASLRISQLMRIIFASIH